MTSRGWRVARRRPWRESRDPYRVLVSEVMLQQTRVETVLRYFDRFLEAFPTAGALAAAPTEPVLERWAGLGYYRRARQLQGTAQAVVARAARLSGTGGWHPEPIGRSTAEGIAAGATSAVLGGIARVIAFFEQRFGAAALTVFVTGGHGSEVAPLLGRPVRVEPDLVLHGLAVLSESLR